MSCGNTGALLLRAGVHNGMQFVNVLPAGACAPAYNMPQKYEIFLQSGPSFGGCVLLYTFAAELTVIFNKQFYEIGFCNGLVTPAQVGISEDIPETGKTLRANSLQKAQYLYDKSGSNCFADDTGLEVDALRGAPGVYTARYAGDDKDFNKNMDKVLRELEVVSGEASMASSLGLKVKPVSRRARFKSVITLIMNGEKHIFEGSLEGVIANGKSGNGGFGYDPIFIPDEYPGKTLADITEEQKNMISHRGKALRAMAEWLAANAGRTAASK